MSFDRLVQELGYTPGNIILACRWCNYTKGMGSAMFFYLQCKKVIDNMPYPLMVGDPKDMGARYQGQLDAETRDAKYLSDKKLWIGTDDGRVEPVKRKRARMKKHIDKIGEHEDKKTVPRRSTEYKNWKSGTR